MDPRFEPYFRARVEQIGREGLTAVPPERFGRREPGQPDTYEAAVLSAIERGIEPYQDGESALIRPDAELMLQLAFTELVAQPIRSVRGGEVDLNDVMEAIETDVRTITREALSARGLGEAISAHDIVNAASRSWSELRTAGFQLWD